MAASHQWPPQAGVEGKAVVFLLPDSKIVCEAFLEDVNNMLNSGEVRDSGQASARLRTDPTRDALF